MAYGQLASPCHYFPDRFRHYIIRSQSPSRHIRPVHGRWGHVWANGGDISEGYVQVSSHPLHQTVMESNLLWVIHRAYPNAGVFSVCKPDVPCITPGTYALLGAAAALG